MKFAPFFKGHFAVVGNSGMGKGVLVAAIARLYSMFGIPVYLLTAKEDEYYSFPADFKTMDQDRFLEEVLKFRASAVRNGEEHALGLIAIIDEAWQWQWKTTKAKQGLEAIPNSGRSRGIECWIQGQRFNQMPPNARTNCENVICFRQKNPVDIEEIVKMQGPEFACVGDLLPGQFVATIEDKFCKGVSCIFDADGKFVRGIEL